MLSTLPSDSACRTRKMRLGRTRKSRGVAPLPGWGRVQGGAGVRVEFGGWFQHQQCARPAGRQPHGWHAMQTSRGGGRCIQPMPRWRAELSRGGCRAHFAVEWYRASNRPVSRRSCSGASRSCWLARACREGRQAGKAAGSQRASLEGLAGTEGCCGIGIDCCVCAGVGGWEAGRWFWWVGSDWGGTVGVPTHPHQAGLLTL